MYELVFAPDDIKDTLLSGKLLQVDRSHGSELEVLASAVREGHEVLVVMVASRGENGVELVHIELLLNYLEQVFRRVLVV